MHLRMREFKLNERENALRLFTYIVKGNPTNYLNSFCIRLAYSWNFFLDVEYADIILPISKGASVKSLIDSIAAIDEFASIINAESKSISDDSNLLSWSVNYVKYGDTKIPLKWRSDPAFDKWGGLCKEVTVGKLSIVSVTHFDINGKRYDISPENYKWQNPKQNPLSINRR